jgi:Cft2 family RNA processing exonuclease
VLFDATLLHHLNGDSLTRALAVVEDLRRAQPHVFVTHTAREDQKRLKAWCTAAGLRLAVKNVESAR